MNEIKAALVATQKIQDYAAKAARVLREGCDGRIMVNSYGIFSSPFFRGSDLRIARDEINKALAIMETTNWPMDATYDGVECAATSDDDEEQAD